MTVICFTNQMDFARDVPDRIVCFRQGVTEKICPTWQIFGNAKSRNIRKYVANVR